MRFYEKLDFSKYADVGPRVYRNLQEFCKKKKPTQDVFDTLTPTILNKHLSSLMPGLTAKVRVVCKSIGRGANCFHAAP